MGNGNVQKIKVLLASLVTVIAAIADIYIIVNLPGNYILLGVTSLILLVAVYLLISGKMQLRDYYDFKSEEQYNKLITSQKACYLQVRKSFRETSGKVDELDKKIAPFATASEINYQKISGLLDSLMQDQKKVAKLTVSRNKENATAMMNSNDRVIQEILKMQETVNSVVQKIEEQTGHEQSQEFEKVEAGQQVLLTKMQELEDSLKNQLENITDKFHEIPKIEKEFIDEIKTEIKSEIEELGSEIKEPIEKPVREESELIEEEKSELTEEMEIEETPLLAEEMVIEETPLSVEDLITEEAPSLAEEMEIEETPLLAEEMEIEETPLLTEEMVIEETPLSVEDLITEEAPLSVDDLVPEQPETITEPSTEDFSNKVMSPEEIAALIAGNNEEILPETMENTVEEEKPPMPDLSDPNRKMSADDIAALIANL